MRIGGAHAQRFCDMDAFAMDIDMGFARTCQKRTGTRRERAGRKIRPYVESENTRDAETLKNAALAHALGTARGLFCRLKHEEHVMGKRVRILV